MRFPRPAPCRLAAFLAAFPAARLAALALATTLSACAYMPFSAIYRLRSFDMGSFDPASLRIGIRISDAIERRPGAVVKVETMFAGDEATRKTQDIALESITDPKELAPLSGFAQAGETVFLYRIAARDVVRVRALQAEGKAATQAAKGKSTVEVKAEPKACLSRPLPPGPFHADLIARLAPGEPYFIVLRRVELRSELANRGVDLNEHLPPC